MFNFFLQNDEALTFAGLTVTYVPELLFLELNAVDI